MRKHAWALSYKRASVRPDPVVEAGGKLHRSSFGGRSPVACRRLHCTRFPPGGPDKRESRLSSPPRRSELPASRIRTSSTPPTSSLRRRPPEPSGWPWTEGARPSILITPSPLGFHPPKNSRWIVASSGTPATTSAKGSPQSIRVQTARFRSLFSLTWGKGLLTADPRDSTDGAPLGPERSPSMPRTG